MSQFQMTHVALVGARMTAFQPLGFRVRTDLNRCLAIPTMTTSWAQLERTERLRLLASQLPFWVHNIITDPDFPKRSNLSMALRRFEGELRDNREDEVVATVLNAGFKNQEMNPLNLPDGMPLRQRCAMVLQIGTWQEAYKRLETDLTETLADTASELDNWMANSPRELE